MRATTLRLANFRCFEDLRLELPEGLVAVVGPNAAGKTSLLEALFVASAGRSARAARDTELISWGRAEAAVEADFLRDDGRPLRVLFGVATGAGGPRRRLLADDKPLRRSAELMARVPLVLFGPADLQLAQASPAVRRRFLNMALARLGPAYADDLARYGRALLQRNRLLARGAPEAQLRPWHATMVEAGAQVVVRRRAMAAELAEAATRLHGELAGPQERLEVEYASQVAGDDAASAAEAYAAQLARSADDERRMGRTLVGPHRDDLRLYINGQPLEEDYIHQPTSGIMPPQLVPEEHVFVLGDNRGASNDSRAFGMVPFSDIIGKAWFRYWPPSDIGLITH